MDSNMNSVDTSLNLAIDTLADIMLSYLAQHKPIIETLALLDQEAKAQMNHEMTAELLGTPDYRLIA